MNSLKINKYQWIVAILGSAVATGILKYPDGQIGMTKFVFVIITIIGTIITLRLLKEEETK